MPSILTSWTAIRKTSGKVLLGRERINQIIGVCNALLRLKVVRGSTDKFFIANEGFVLQLRNSAGTAEAVDGSGAWKGDYNPATEYSYGDIVQLSPSEAATYTNEEDEQVTLGGTYVWNNIVAAAGVVPVHVMMPTYNPNQWRTLSTWPVVETKCVDGEAKDFAADAQEIPE